jgi:hypothetical protein
MANVYVKSTTGNDGNGGTSWADAKGTLVGAAAVAAAGDTVNVSQAHAETVASAISANWSTATLAAPIYVICADDGATPPTSVAASATVTTTGNSSITPRSGGKSVFFYGITFIVGSGASGTAIFSLGGAVGFSTYDNCSFQLATTGASASIQGAGGAAVNLYNCTFKFAATAQGFKPTSGTTLNVYGGSLLSGGTSPTALVVPQTSAGIAPMIFDGFDISAASATINMVGSVLGGARVTFKNCKLPTSWSGVLLSGTVEPDVRVSMYNCDSGATNYRLLIEDSCGTITHETTLIKTGGASNGTTGISWKLVSNANATFASPLRSDEIVIWNDATGSSKTVTVEILHDSATNLKDDAVWLEVAFLGSSATPIGSRNTDWKADFLASAADQTTSSETWTTTGMSNPNTQNLSVTFTPQMKGFIHAKVCVAKASYTLYVDPMLTVT